jgi:3-oxoacyl-[acyl-carrier protein] reductase
MDLGIAGKRAVIAAASDGLGLAAARCLIADGVTVAICGRDRERVQHASSSLGPAAVPIVADVSTADGATAFIDAATNALGGIDILVANGGGPPRGTVDDVDLDAYRNAFEANALATIAMCRAALPAMRAQQWGRIVAITSVVAKQPAEYLVLSNTARAGLTAFLKTTAAAVGPDGVTVNSAMPGSHATARIRALYGDNPPVQAIPMRSLGRPEDFGAVVAFLCSDQARYITGQAIVVDGGGYPALW